MAIPCSASLRAMGGSSGANSVSSPVRRAQAECGVTRHKTRTFMTCLAFTRSKHGHGALQPRLGSLDGLGPVTSSTESHWTSLGESR